MPNTITGPLFYSKTLNKENLTLQNVIRNARARNSDTVSANSVGMNQEEIFNKYSSKKTDSNNRRIIENIV